MKHQHPCGLSSINSSNGTARLGSVFPYHSFHHTGFTLIEVLVVTIILGIALSLAVANLIPDEREKVRIESERVLGLLEQIRDESAMSGKAIAVEVKDNSMQFFERDQKSVETNWLPLEALNGTAITAREFASGTMGELTIGSPSANNTRSADAESIATFQPAGVAVPFEVRIQSVASALNTQIIRVDALGNLSLVATAINTKTYGIHAHRSPDSARHFSHCAHRRHARCECGHR
jgi:type II secretion system protein H